MTTTAVNPYMRAKEKVDAWGGLPAAFDSVVKIETVGSAADLLALGGRIHASGYGTFCRISSDALSAAVKEAATEAFGGVLPKSVDISVAPPQHGGQEGGSNGNILLVIVPAFSFSTTKEQKKAALVVEVGCEHSMRGKNLGRCYNEYTCQKCGYYYRVDSSD